MDTALIFALISLAIAIISSIISVASYVRSGRFQKYEYAVRIQLIEKRLFLSSESARKDPAFHYRALIENKGTKPLKIKRVYLDYGHRESHETRLKRIIEDGFYLGPDESEVINVVLDWKDVEEAQRRGDTKECHFFFRLSYFDLDENIVEITRKLCGLTKSGVIFNVHSGNDLI